MSNEDIQPYDFTTLDAAVYDPANPDAYEQIAADTCYEVLALQESAFADVESQSPEDGESYLRKYVVREWRSFEMAHAEDSATRRGRVLPIREGVILGILMRSDEVDEDFLAVAAQYTREELLQKVAEASEPWLKKYNVQLDYDSEVEYKFSEWEIFIDVPTEWANNLGSR